MNGRRQIEGSTRAWIQKAVPTSRTKSASQAREPASSKYCSSVAAPSKGWHGIPAQPLTSYLLTDAERAERRAATQQLCAQLPPRPSEVRLSHQCIVAFECREQGYPEPCYPVDLARLRVAHVFTTRLQIICPAEAESEYIWVAAAELCRPKQAGV
jgi:hypothetical protein